MSRWIFVKQSAPASVPESVSGLSVWLDADDTAFSNNDEVQTWINKGSGNNAESTTANNRPRFRTNLQNGKPGVDFMWDSSRDSSVYPWTGRMKIASLELNTNISVFMVAKASSEFAVLIMHGNPDSSAGARINGEYINYRVRRGATINEGKVGGNLIRRGGGPAIASWVIGSITASGTNMGRAWLNGSEVDQAPATAGGIVPNTALTEDVHIDYAPSNASGGGMGSQYHEILIYNQTLGTADREKVEGYLAWKWGLEGNLPNGHPYKNVAP